MEASRTIVDWSEELIVAETGEHDTLRLRAHGELLLSKRDLRRDWWMRVIAGQRTHNLPLYLVFDPMDRSVLDIFLCVARRIEYVAPEPLENRLAVGLLAAQAVVFVKLNHSEFARIRGLLAANAGQPKDVLMAIHPETGELLDARDSSDA